MTNDWQLLNSEQDLTSLVEELEVIKKEIIMNLFFLQNHQNHNTIVVLCAKVPPDLNGFGGQLQGL